MLEIKYRWLQIIHGAVEAIIDQNGCVFFLLKKHLPIWLGQEISLFFTPKFHSLGPGEGFFPDLWVFSRFTESAEYYSVNLAEASSFTSDQVRSTMEENFRIY